MAWDDKDDFKAVFPVRTGNAIGTALENRMISAVGGPDTIRTRVLSSPDGSTTILKTRGGHPEFVTTRKTESLPVTYPNLFCRLLSEDTVRGADVRWIGGASYSYNANHTWPLQPTVKGPLKDGALYRAASQTAIADTQGMDTWYDTRLGAAKQFSDVLSWSSILVSAQNGAASTAHMMNYYSYWTAVNPASYPHTYNFPATTFNSVPLGAALPGAYYNNSVRLHRYTKDNHAVCTLYRNGVTTGIIAAIAAACLVKDGAQTRFRALLLPNFTDPTATVAYTLAIADYDEAGNVMAQTPVVLPAGITGLTGASLFRWNASGTQAAGLISYTANSTTTYAILLVGSDGSSALGPVYGQSGVVEYANKTLTTLSAAWDKATVIYRNEVAALDYVGDTLTVLRRYVVDRTYDTGSSLVTKNQYDRFESQVYSWSTGRNVSLSLIQEPAGTVQWAATWTNDTTQDFSEVWTWGPDPVYPQYPWLQVRTDVSVQMTNTNTNTGWKDITAFSADLRSGVVFCTESAEAIPSTYSGTYTVTQTGPSTYVSTTTNTRTEGIVGVTGKLIDGGAAFTVFVAPNSFVETTASSSQSTSSTNSWNTSMSRFAPAWTAVPLTDTRAPAWSGGFSGSQYGVGSLQATLWHKGGLAVFSALYPVNLPYDMAAGSTANYTSVNKVLRKVAGAWATSDLMLPAYGGVATAGTEVTRTEDATLKWLVEPLIL